MTYEPGGNIYLLASQAFVCSPGQTSSRLDHQSTPDGGDVSPACLKVAISVWEPSFTDIPVDESHDKDR